MTETEHTGAAPADTAPADAGAQQRTAMQELVDGNRRRRRARMWAGIAAIPFAIVALLLVVKILSMYVFAHQAVRSFVASDYDATVAAARWQGPLNWFEPYKAPYNLGTGLAELGQLDDARRALEDAVPLAPGLEVCAVRYNLGTVVERQGDEATGDGEIDRGQELYQEALQILAENPEECRSEAADDESPDRQRPTGESLDELERRILEKLQQEQDQQDQGEGEDDGESDGGEGDQSPEDEGPSDSQLDELEEKLEDGAQERQEREQGGQDGAPGGADKPW